jgi:hypothetical protein
MADDLTPTDYAFLILLKVEGREISNTEMEALYGVRLVGDTYAKLNGAGHIHSTKSGSTYSHVLTTKGETELQSAESAKKVPWKKNSHKAQTLFWAALKTRHVDRPQAGDGASAPVRDGRPLDARIRDAYATLATEPGAWVSLTRLRPLFADVSKPDLDKALERLLKAPDVNLDPEPNQKTLTVEDRRSAVLIGGENRHLLAIGMR